MNLLGKVAIVTGGGGGIGRAICVAMAAAGAKVLVNDIGGSVDGEGRSSSPADETCKIIRNGGGSAAMNTESVSSWEGAQGIVRSALENFGRLDIVVNNAGILQDAMFHKMNPAQWTSALSVHLDGSFFVSRAAADHFREQQQGAYVHMTSTSGLVGAMGQANYAAAKAGIAALSRCIAIDMKRFNVRSNCIAPFAWSRMVGSVPIQTPEQQARMEKLQLMTPDKIAPLAVYLASDAAAEITGQIFASRMHEIMLLSQTRPVRSVHRDGGWSPDAIATHAIPALKSSLVPLERTQEVFAWDPV